MYVRMYSTYVQCIQCVYNKCTAVCVSTPLYYYMYMYVRMILSVHCVTACMYRIAGNVCGELKFALCGFDRDLQTFKCENILSAIH